jgi:hypothetical protein
MSVKTTERIKEAIRRAHVVGALFSQPERKRDEEFSVCPACGSLVASIGGTVRGKRSTRSARD